MHNLLRQIVSSPWMISESAAISYLPQVARLIEGKSVNFEQPTIKDYIVAVGSSNNDDDQSNKRVAIIPIRGVILKDDQECGPRGLETKLSLLNKYANDSSIDAIILDLDTPGGQASFLDTFTNAISSVNKPVLAYYNSMCASAGYYIASSCDEIYASESTDIVGSIGTLISFLDVRGHLKKKGYNLIEVYADQSTEKNQVFKKAMDGDDSQLRKELLNPFAQSFIDHVKSNRTISNEKVFKGGTYMSKEAQELGLINGIKSLEQVIARAVELSNQKPENGMTSNKSQQTSNIMKKNLLAVATLLGMTALESKDGYISLSEENVEKIGDALIASAAKDETIAEQSTSLEEKESSITSLSEKVSGLESSVTDLSSTINGFESKLQAAINGSSVEETIAKADENEFAEDGTISESAAPFQEEA